MNRFLYPAKAILLGLLITQILASLHVYLSDVSLYRTVTTITAWVLCLMAVVRMTAWLVGDYASWLGDLPRTEAGVLLVLALALVWLRPRSGLPVDTASATDAEQAASAPVDGEPV